MAKTPTTQLSLKFLRDRGETPFVAESYNAHIRRSRDLYGFIDIVSLRPETPGVLGVQTTSANNLSTRIKKAEALPYYWKWLACENDVEFHGWKKSPKGTWEPRLVFVSIRELY